MKKIIIILLCSFYSLSFFCGCADKDSQKQNSEHTANVELSDSKDETISDSSQDNSLNISESGEFGADGNNLKWILTDDGILTISGIGEMGTDSVPWQNRKNSIYEITVEEGVESFSISASSNYMNLKSISFPSTMKNIATNYKNVEISNQMFYECNSLVEIVVDKGNSVYNSIDGVLFGEGGSKLLTYPKHKPDAIYNVPKTVKVIAPYSFKMNTKLKGINLESVETIQEDAFSGCSGLEQIIIPDSVKTIEDYAFVACESVKSIVIGKGLTELGDGAFSQSGTETVKIKNGIAYISMDCFAYNKSLKEIYLPKSIKTCYADAFKECGSLANVYYAGDEKTGDFIRYNVKKSVNITYNSSEIQ